MLSFLFQNASGGLLEGTGDIPPQRVNLYAHGAPDGNATSYLVSDQGLTVISDIDDILRVTKIYEPKQGLLNTFAKPFTPWMNMPDVYRNWSESLPNMHFHYLTTTPEQVTRNYMQFIYSTYPGGSFDTRPLNFSNVAATLSIRKFLLDKIFKDLSTPAIHPRCRHLKQRRHERSVTNLPAAPHSCAYRSLCVPPTISLLTASRLSCDGDAIPWPSKVHILAQHLLDRLW